ncbi:MAG: glycoside hydrolase N-terminal domain-containing protein [Bacteroidales bacterium]
MKYFTLLLLLAILFSCRNEQVTVVPGKHDLRFNDLASSWDEAIPLGNGMLGELVWKKDGKLRLSLDRADLWDLRPMPNLDRPEWKYSWVREQWLKNNYGAVQEAFDRPYDELPAPSKIPACAVEFDIEKLGEVESVTLDVKRALCEVKWKNGARFLSFVSADKNCGWYRFENLPESIKPELVVPAYNTRGDSKALEMSFHDLDRLGYQQGSIEKHNNSEGYSQEGWGGFKYHAWIEWKSRGRTEEGCWSVSSEFPGWEKQPDSRSVVREQINDGFFKSLMSHQQWWSSFWDRSAISVPDTVLEKQWYLEMYKFGSAARKGAPPISLQAVWTADNGKIPPWKGDFHNDLNTQLSYWPAYGSNHTDLEEGFIDWLLQNKETFRKYTSAYFGVEGLNVPGVATLTGEPMGGWIQYSFGPTVGAWLSHHFYLHWRYTMDREFLKEKAYPWISEVAAFLDNLSVRDGKGLRKLPISSSPEIFDNSAKAWFGDITNYDLALVRWTFLKAGELAGELGLKADSAKWHDILQEWPDFTVDDETGLMFAPGVKYEQSHRHFSHLMAFHPLGLIDNSGGADQQQIIEKTLQNLVKTGPDWWCGYSYSWLGSLQARAGHGKEASGALKTFATCFCLPNSFHVNGDQTKTGKSKFTYRPFTLEGNFAFAAGLQEMLIQSHTGSIVLFPAIPGDWDNVSFSGLRTEGAFLVTAVKQKDGISSVKVLAEKGGSVKMKNPFTKGFSCDKTYKTVDGCIVIDLLPGETASLAGLD